MPRRKKVKEADYTVSTEDPVTGEVETKDVRGVGTPRDAIQRAGAGNANFANPKGQVTVAPKQPGGPPGSRTAPVSARPTQAKAGTQGMGGLTEGFDSTKFRYDYTIGLPQGFAGFLKKTKGRTRGLVVEERNGRVYMTVEDAEAMDKLMGKLKRSINSKVVETRDKTRVVVRGIMGSMK